MNLKTLAGMNFLLCTFPVWAIEPFTVKDIRVEGIQRTEAGTVFSYLPIKVGDTMDDQQAAAAIHALYATGFFKDVKRFTSLKNPVAYKAWIAAAACWSSMVSPTLMGR